MRLVRYTSPSTEGVSIGIVDRTTDQVYGLQAVGEHLGIEFSDSIPDLFRRPRWRDLLHTAEGYARDSSDLGSALSDAQLRAPVSNPPKVICVGLNYREHVKEGDREPPEQPILFSKFRTSIVGPDGPIEWDPSFTSQVDYEVELAVIIGDEARRVDDDDARNYVAGYTVANDVSARDLQYADDQWVRGKSLDTFCPLGPAIVTADSVGDPHDLDLWTEVNGERLQESNTSNLIFDTDTLVSFCSAAFTLQPGDVILTGTPPGVGVHRDPPRLLDDGDEVVVAVDGIGELRNVCRHDR